MHDQMADEDSGIDVPSQEETISTEIYHPEFQNGEISSKATVEPESKKSSDLDSSFSSVDVKVRKIKKGRRKSGSKKHRAGKNQKRKYIPFHKRTLAQQMKVDEYSEKKGNRQREFLKSRGISLAPHNTNQFIIDSHADEVIDDSEPIWEDHDQLIYTPTPDLVEEYIRLEDDVEFWTKVKVFHDEIRRYDKEIDELLKLNAKLEKIVEKKEHTLEKDLSSLDIGPSM